MFRSGLVVLLGLVFAPSFGRPLLAAGSAQYFLLVVWDEMRPNFVSSELTPTLHALQEGGVRFANHRSVYPASTEVNGTVLATGVFPQRNGVSANKEYRREIDFRKQFGTESLPAVRRGDAMTGGRALGSFAHVHVVACGKFAVARIIEFVRRLSGVTEVLDQATAARLMELPPDRMGEFVVCSGRDVVSGRTPEWHDLTLIEAGLRSYGGRYEEMVPFVISAPMTPEYQAKARRDPRNFDLFDFLYKGTIP